MKSVQYLVIVASIMVVSTSFSYAGGYIGASIGRTDVDVTTFDDGTSIALVGGYRVNENLAVEGSYINLGDSDDGIAPVWTIEADGLNFSVVGIAPVNPKMDVFAKAGMFMWDLTVDEAGFGQFYSNDGTDLSIGIGAYVNLENQIGLIFEYQKFDVDDEDFSNISFGARINY